MHFSPEIHCLTDTRAYLVHPHSLGSPTAAVFHADPCHGLRPSQSSSLSGSFSYHQLITQPNSSCCFCFLAWKEVQEDLPAPLCRRWQSWHMRDSSLFSQHCSSWKKTWDKAMNQEIFSHAGVPSWLVHSQGCPISAAYFLQTSYERLPCISTACRFWHVSVREMASRVMTVTLYWS